MQNASLSVFVSIRVCLSALQIWIIFAVGLACHSWQQFVSVGPSWSSIEAQSHCVLCKLHAVCVRCAVMVLCKLHAVCVRCAVMVLCKLHAVCVRCAVMVLCKLHAVCVRCAVMVTYDLLKFEKRAPWPEFISLCLRWPNRISSYKMLISRTTSLTLHGHNVSVNQHCSCCGYSLQQICSDTSALHPL